MVILKGVMGENTDSDLSQGWLVKGLRMCLFPNKCWFIRSSKTMIGSLLNPMLHRFINDWCANTGIDLPHLSNDIASHRVVVQFSMWSTDLNLWCLAA